MKRVVLVGSGGVGTIAAYTLEQCADIEVTTIVRSDFDTVKENGYKIESVDYGNVEYRPSHLVRSIEEAGASGAYDYVVICMKNTPDILRVETVVEPVISENTTIVLMQNGIAIEDAFFQNYPKNIVLSGVSMISSANHGAVISHVGHDALSIGYFPNQNVSLETQEAAALEFVKLYKTEKNTCVYDENVKFSRWRKLVYNAVFNPICALTNLDVGRLELFGGLGTLVKPAMKEVLAIAKSDGVDLPEKIMDSMISSDDGVYYAPSMLVDMRKGNYIELEVICGNVVRIAAANGVDAPVLTIIYNLLSLVQKRSMEEKGKIVVPEIREIPNRE